MNITPKEARQIIGNHTMECSSCPYTSDYGCQWDLPVTCADVALQAGKVMLEEAEQDAFDMAYILKTWLEWVGSKLGKEFVNVEALAKTDELIKKYEDHR